MSTTFSSSPVHEHRSQKSFNRQRSFSVTRLLLHRRCIFFMVTVMLVVVFLQIQTLKHPLLSSSTPSLSTWSVHQWGKLLLGTTADEGCARRLENATSRLSGMVTFVPLKDLRFASTAMEGNTWFMSSINDTFDGEMAQYIHFPSEASKGRLLCLAGQSRSNGTWNSYALAWRDSLPHGAELLGGLTFVSDTYYDYDNIWHGLSASLPFVGWHKWRQCVLPARWVLYHWGELRTNMATWVRTILEATFGQQTPVEDLNRGNRPTCFEEAVVFRHNEGYMPKLKRRELYDMIRCKARKYCNITADERGSSAIRLTLFLRTGARSFKNDAAVIGIFTRECSKIEGCRVTVTRPNNLTFCDQVKLMSDTDVLVSQHGAQLTNMIFMDRNSSVMEFFPKGWLEHAGIGQYVYHWLADWSGMRHQGAYRDTGEHGGGERCLFPEKDPRCFFVYKDQQIMHHEAYFANWTSKVLNEVKQYKLSEVSRISAQKESSANGACSCE